MARLEALQQLEGEPHGKAACALQSHRTYGRYIRQTKTGKLRLDKVKIQEDAHLDGKYLRPEVLALALKLRQAEPTRSVRQMIRLMELDGAVAPGKVSRSTLDRHLRAQECSRKALQRPAKDRRRWQRDRPPCGSLICAGRLPTWKTRLLHGRHPERH